MKPILKGVIWGVAAWVFTTILMMVAFASSNSIGDVAYRSVYGLANWPLMIWHLVDPLNPGEHAYAAGILRNLVGWLGLMVTSSLIYHRLNSRKKKHKGSVPLIDK
ncbi:MAG: hypothetical protein ACYDC1_12675 [Limisphaerales bacterium]